MQSSTSEGAVPLIYSPAPETARLGWQGRLVALAIASACLATLVIAAVLKPSPQGLGTHTAMGFQNCQFLERTGIPCPSCGMTTSTSWFVRGNWLASFYVQPMGFVIALGLAATFWGTLYIAATGRPSHRLLRFLPAKGLLIGLMGFGIAAWA